jgi:hypothetical protein
MNTLSRRNYLVALSIGGLSALAGCNDRQPDRDIDKDTEDNPIPLPSVLQRDSLPTDILTQHIDTLSTRQFARTIVTEETENSVRREYKTTDFRQHTKISINSSLVREVYRTREHEYIASYQNSEPRYSQKQSQLRSTENWGAQDEITELFNDLSNVSLRGLDKENEVYLYDAQTSPVLDDSNVSVAITVNPIQITRIEVTESRAEQIPRTYRMESGPGDIRAPSWISDAEQFSRSVVVGKRQGALFVYNDSSQPIPSGSAITIIHPNGNVYTYQLDSTLQSEEILFLEILQSGSVTGLKDSPPDSSVKLVLREEPYYLIGFGPNGEQYFDTSTNTAS